MSIRKNILAIDIGNSRIKLLYGDNILKLSYLEMNWKELLMEFINKAKDFTPYYCSVNDKIANEIIQILSSKYAVNSINILDIINYHRLLIYHHIKGIGADRVLSLVSALYYEQPPLFTVDCGTAVTVNVVDENRICLGGAIFPGIDAQQFALDKLTQNLYKINIKEVISLPAKNTEDALNSGIILSVVGGIREIVGRICWEKFNTKQISVIFTGGGANQIYKHFNYPAKSYILGDLNLKGIVNIVNDYYI